ncbi:double-stranded RNA-binding protein 1-like [Impatiens glandulifera]|uniref:double-stranded RNA-binding protein 1-like n=1 Tax=Impatiens glandulifera TaxID=253017 RepID=UPI001FB11EF3|nr:double-stranded RNA-binding protein 1-like [Impatiens glandulifera]
MYKSKLHQFCQQNLWKLPEYSNSKDGPDHNSCFTTTITVNGVSFQSSTPCRTIKAAQDSAAEVALNHLSDSGSNSEANDNSLSSALPASQNGLEAELTIQEHTGNVTQSLLIPSGVKRNKKSQDGHHWYKHRLQIYAQKKNIDLPGYSFERQGPQHASRFKCKVTVGGQCYESTNFFVTLKEAQNDAAKIAFDQISLNEDQKDDFVLHKNALQELAHKRGFLSPSYTTTSCGPGHAPTFLATVLVDGKMYQGVAAKSKKQAEVNAAKSAYDSLKNGALHLNEQHQPIALTEENLQMAIKCETQLESKEPVPSEPNTQTAADNGKAIMCETQLENKEPVLSEPNTQTAADNGKAIMCETQLENKEPVLSEPNTKTAADNGKAIMCETQLENKEPVLSEPNTKTAADNGKRPRSPTQCENVLQARKEMTIERPLHKILVYSSQSPRPKVPNLEGK